ncbi:tetratricopeptide repeat protein [Microcoleus vaginatus]|uniref:tetratricopeptide repeat protein n=1 Tax=Microcoleus vaginatus TaxID=119532 RepID=UPI001F612E9A|nr:tetratricopeptide repeat protein [Microcoleus vaginatus HSN003]
MANRPRAKRSLIASVAGIEQARIALTHKVWTYDNLEEELTISRQPVVNFFNGKTVDRKIFVNICKKLDLDWQTIKIVDSPISPPESKLEQKESRNTQPANAEPEQIEEVLDNFCDEVVVERVRSHSPISAEDFDELGINKAKERDFEGALENFNRAIKLNPNYADAYNNRANVRYELGDFPGAIEDYTEAILLNPKCSDFHQNGGIISCELRDYRGAQADHSRAIQLDPNNHQAYNSRGFARLQMGDVPGALKDFTQAIELNPDYALAWNNRGHVYLESGNLERALEDYTLAAQLNLNNPKIFYNLGVIHYSLGNKEKALEDYNQAIELKRDFAEAYYNRGIVHYELGDSHRGDEDFHTAKNLYRVQGKQENYQKVLNLIEELQQED